MINLKDNCFYRTAGAVYNIDKWEVWFMTPFGVFTELRQAVEIVELKDLDPELCITPIPVALNQHHNYELFFPRR